MGTNYYHHRDVCPTCGRAGETEHIGKASYGWTFSFHGTPEIRSWDAWREVLRAGGEIRDECGRVVTLEEFEKLVESKRGAALNHTTYCLEGMHPGDREHALRHCWLDPDGNSFSGAEFS